jgi:hypothetical protein
MPSFRSTLIAGLALGLSAAPALAQVHPHYTKALTDLRLARDLLTAPDSGKAEGFERTAVGDINQALDEIHHAAIDEGKPMDDHPPIDANVSHKDRLHEILTLVESASRDLAIDEDDQKASGWRDRAVKDTADARAFVMAAIANEQPQR